MAYGPGAISSPSSAGYPYPYYPPTPPPLIPILIRTPIHTRHITHCLCPFLMAALGGMEGIREADTQADITDHSLEAAIPVVHMAEVLVVIQVEVPAVFTVIAFSSRDNIWNRAGAAAGSSCNL
ncbi:hypothetical protein [Paenibacillus illinoisensis]|uniref:hypothetical protein n=1 Tax=Paenibacillus illinoisensis TaxID=59845 RepID=UPI003019A4E4